MTQYWCSICFKDNNNLTIVYGTVICADCLQKLCHQCTNNNYSLRKNMRYLIIEENK